MAGPSGHAKLSPSAAHRWLTCPASVAACAGIESPDTEHSLAGTAGHWAFAEWLTKGTPPAVGTKAENGIVITQEMLDHVGMAVGWVRQYLAGKQATMLVEEQVEIGAYFGLPEGLFWGTTDLFAMCVDGELLVFDLKLGYVEVEAEENEQLLSYAAGFIDLIGALFDRARFVIAQPKNGGVKEWAISLEDLERQLAEMKPKVLRVLEPDAPFCPEPTACKWCPIAGTCAAAQRESLALARRTFDETPAQIVEHISLEDLGLLLAKADLVEQAIAAARAKALALLTAGVDVPGYKRVRASTKRRWKSGVEAQVEALVGAERAYEKKLVSFTVVEKLVGKDKVEELVEKPEGEPVLAPASDKRPALGPALPALDEGLEAMLG